MTIKSMFTDQKLKALLSAVLCANIPIPAVKAAFSQMGQTHF